MNETSFCTLSHILDVSGLLEQTLRSGRGHRKISDLHKNPWSKMISWRGRYVAKQRKESTQTVRENTFIILSAEKISRQCCKVLRNLLHASWQLLWKSGTLPELSSTLELPITRNAFPCITARGRNFAHLLL